MSLTEALLLDPQKLDVWVAVRTDGVAGSGTEEDPYDASVRAKPVLTGIAISRVGTEATVTANNHGYANGNVVVIAGATGADGNFYNGTFPIYGVTQNTFKYLMNGTPGANASGSLTCTLDPYQFDAVMRSLPANTAIHLGPGIFETKGFSFSPADWQPKSGWRIVGSGIDITVLKIVGASTADLLYTAIGNNYLYAASDLAGFEASDFTVDCNLAGQPIPPGKDFAPVAYGALLVGGSHIRLRRIRAINFGTQSLPAECFVITTGWSFALVNDAVDCVVEDWIVEQPALNNAGMTTTIGVGAVEQGSGLYWYPRACAIRNCLVDCEYKVNPVGISAITFSGTTATVTTQADHGRAVNDWVRIAGALVNGSLSNPFNGSFKITSASSTTFQYTMASTPAANPVGEMWVDRFSSHYVAISSVSKSGTGPFTVTIVTATPHFRVPGGNVVIGNVTVGGVPSTILNGAFTISQAVDAVTLKYLVTTDPGTPDASQGNAFIGVSFQGPGADGGTAAVVEGNRVFNCRVGNYNDTGSTRDSIVRNNHFRSVVSGPYRNFGTVDGNGDIPLVSLVYSTGTNRVVATTSKPHGFRVNDSVIISGDTSPDASHFNGGFQIAAVTSTAPFTFEYPPNGTPTGQPQGNHGYGTDDRPFIRNAVRQRLLNSLTSALESGVLVATAESSYPQHGIEVGDSVYVSKASLDSYNGFFQVTGFVPAVPGVSNEKFKYVLPSDPGASSPSGYYGRLWQTKKLVIENNLIELIPSINPYGPPVGISLYQQFDSGSQFVFTQVIIRGNVIRQVDNLSDPTLRPLGIRLFNCQNAIVEDNVIDLDTSTPLRQFKSNPIRSFNNQKSSGVVLQFAEEDVNGNFLRMAADLSLTTAIEDVALLSL